MISIVASRPGPLERSSEFSPPAPRGLFTGAISFQRQRIERGRLAGPFYFCNALQDLDGSSSYSAAPRMTRHSPPGAERPGSLRPSVSFSAVASVIASRPHADRCQVSDRVVIVEVATAIFAAGDRDRRVLLAMASQTVADRLSDVSGARHADDHDRPRRAWRTTLTSPAARRRCARPSRWPPRCCRSRG